MLSLRIGYIVSIEVYVVIVCCPGPSHKTFRDAVISYFPSIVTPYASRVIKTFLRLVDKAGATNCALSVECIYIVSIEVYVVIVCCPGPSHKTFRDAVISYFPSIVTPFASRVIKTSLRPVDKAGAIHTNCALSVECVLSTCPFHTNSGCGKERRIFIGPW